MHRSVHMLLSASVIALGNSPAFAQESAPVAGFIDTDMGVLGNQDNPRPGQRSQ